MRMVCRQELISAKPAFSSQTPIQKKSTAARQSFEQDNQVANQQEETFSMSIGESKQSWVSNKRKIKRSVINRSCINVVNYSCRALNQVPPDLMRNGQWKLGGIQKLDLSCNNIWDIRQLYFGQMSSLKELILNDNKISELPFAQINTCKGLRLINLNNNQLFIMPMLTKISYLQAKNNPLNLITAELVKLSNLQFFTFDWLEYLVDSQPNQCQDKYKEYALQYGTFKRNILEQIDYKNQHNVNFCDFHCYFNLQFNTLAEGDNSLSFLSQLIIKTLHKNCTFFVNYLKSFQNQINYAKLMHRNRLLLQIVLQSSNTETLQLFCLKKSNYSQIISDEIYYQSIKLCCHYACYTMFRYLFEIKTRRKRIQTVKLITNLVHQTLARYNRQKQSDKMLFDLVGLYIDIAASPIIIKIPCQFNSRLFKSLSTAMLDIYQHEWLSHYFKLEFDNLKTTPLHFAMKSKNEELLKILLMQSWDVFQKNQNGTSCKFTAGGTQISRKMVWKRERALIKKQFKQEANFQLSRVNQKLNQKLNNSVNKQIQNLIGYAQLQPSFMVYQSPMKQTKNEYQGGYNNLKLFTTKEAQKDQLLSHLLVRANQLHMLSWKQHYLRKMINIDVITFLLHKLSCIDETGRPKRIQNWIKTIDSLVEVFDLAGKQGALIQFQVIQAIQWINSLARENKFANQIQLQAQRKSIQANNFWCCQGIPYS